MSDRPCDAAPSERFLEQIVRFQDGSIGTEECAVLAATLEHDAEARRQFIDMQVRSAAIHDRLRQVAYRADGPPAGRMFSRWVLQRAVAAVAGVALGICGASLVFAYALPWTSRPSTIFSDGFESGQPPVTSGVPTDPGHWGGDYVEVVGAQGGVRPADGRSMLRFLRGDHDGMPLADSRSSHTFRLFDVRGLRAELRGDTAIVQLSTRFNAAAGHNADPVTCALTIIALDEQTVSGEGFKKPGTLSRDSLAMAVSNEVTLDDDPESWQRVSNEMRLPPGTAYVMIRIGVSQKKGIPKPDFPAHFADDVQLVLGHRPELASR